jgi:hypothetical protein
METHAGGWAKASGLALPHLFNRDQGACVSEDKIGSEFDRPDRLKVVYMPLVERFLSGLQIKPTLKLPPDKELADALAKAKGKKAQVYVNLDDSLLWFEVRVPGSKPFRLGAKDLDSLRDNDKQREILEKLADTTKLTTRAAVEKWHSTHYGKEEISFFRQTIHEMIDSRDKLQPQVTALKAFKFDGKDAKLRAALHVHAKAHSHEHYLTFVEDIDTGSGAKAIYDKYIAPGASFPVNLPPAVAAPIAKAVSAGAKPDFSTARKLIVGVIDAKLIGDYRKEILPDLEKELNRLKAKLPGEVAEFKKVGGTNL